MRPLAAGVAERDREAILQVHHAWLNLERHGRFQELLELCVADVELKPPGQEPIVGTRAVRRFLSENAVEIVSIETTEIHIEIRGDQAFKSACYQTRFRDGDASEIVVAGGRHRWELARTSAGWKVASVRWHAD